MKLKWTKTEPKLSQNEVKMKPKSMQNQYENDTKKYDFRSFQIDYSSSAGAGRKRMRALVPASEKMGALAPIVASSIYIYIYIHIYIYIYT